MFVDRVGGWYSYPYSEGSPSVPVPVDYNKTPDVLVDVNMYYRRNGLFTDLRLNIPFTEAYGLTYVKVTLTDGSSASSITVYGYVDEVTELSAVRTETSESGELPVVSIRWHLDTWRTYARNVHVTGGMMRRTSREELRIPQPYPFRYYELGGESSLQPSNAEYGGPWWVYIVFSEQADSNTYIRIGCFPVQPSQPVQANRVMVGQWPALTFQDMVSGRWDEKLGLNPDNVYGVFAGSVPPMEYTSGTFQLALPWVAKQYGSCGLWIPSNDEELNSFDPFRELAIRNYDPSSIEPETNDIQTTYVLGYSMETVGAIPWGFRVRSATVRAIVDPTAAYVQVRLFTTSSPQFDNYSGADGMKFNIPMLSLPVGSNSYSSYVYSGARDRMAESMRIQTESDVVHGLAGAANSAIGGAVVGALGGPVGAVIGGVVGLATGVVGTAAGGGYDVAVKNKNVMSMEDSAHAAQPDPLAIPGGGYAFMRRHPWASVRLAVATMDQYSQTARSEDIALYGYHVSRPQVEGEVEDIIANGGACQVSGCSVSQKSELHQGTYTRVPTRAIQDIVAKLESGVSVRND